jgi:hypothetical protein
MAGGGDVCGAARRAEQREEMERLTGGPGEENFIYFFFFLGL